MARRGSSMGALPLPSRASQVRCTPVTMPDEVGDGGDQGGPRLERRVVVSAVVAGGMEAQRREPQRRR